MKKYMIGIDEVGRGALAGPVVVAAAMIRCDRAHEPRRSVRGRTGVPLRDSKKLSARQREKWAVYLSARPDVDTVVARVSARGIERMNISRAANAAAARAFRRLAARHPEILGSCTVVLDGGLFLGNSESIVPAATVVKGDELFPAVAMASIVAKVARDRLLVRLAKKYPVYGFERHKGYGTAHHFAALKKYGPCREHRKTFLKHLKTS